ncbi:Hint domain-containing protein [Yoonia sp.]|uniref:Hint domain-containing protein n=1 Tax=Yoonia sp. TaxID=2212373 RepID=UPI002FD9EBD0
MAFSDVIDDYTTGATGTLNAPPGSAGAGETVGYTVTSGVNTVTLGNTDQGAEILRDASTKLVIDFDIPVTGLSLTFDRSNSPEVYFVEIDGVRVDINTLIANNQATFTTSLAGGGAGTHIVTADGGVSSTGSFDNNSLGFLTLLVPVNSIGVVGDGTAGNNFDIIEVGIDTMLFDVLCFAAGTLISTAKGDVPIETLAVGDRVMGTDGREHVIRTTQTQHMRPVHLARETRRRPVRIAAGALGQGLPTRDLVVSRQHRVLVASRIAQRLCGTEEVLVPAICLVGLPGIDIDRDLPEITYHHMILDDHQVIIANGAPAETLYTGPMARAVLEHDDVARAQAGTAPHHSAPARLLADNKTAKALAAAHARHGRPLLESWQAAKV